MDSYGYRDSLNESDLRISKHPLLDFKRRKPVFMKFNGENVKAYEGESIAAALFANGIRIYSYSIKFRRPRGFFCGIGKCSSCLMRVNGMPHTRICMEPVKDGIEIEYENHETKPHIFRADNLDFKTEKIETDLVVVGGGPAGLSAGTTAAQLGVRVHVIDENFKPGGQLMKQTHKFFGSMATYAGYRGMRIGRTLLAELKKAGGQWISQTSVAGIYRNRQDFLIFAVSSSRRLLDINTRSLIIASGARENMILFPNNDLPGIYGAGGVQTLMNVYGVKPGNNALIVGAGNVGLIVAYQLIQAGVNVKMVVEAMPRIGGYLVHASKLRRLGVPILTSHTIKEVTGEKYVKEATIIELDENLQGINGTEKKVSIDLICIAVGLTPSSEIALQAGCKEAYIPELGGRLAIHNKNLRSTILNISIAGDVSGIEEANTAIVEGKIAGTNVAIDHYNKKTEAEKIRTKAFADLNALRASPFSKRIKEGKKKVWHLWRENVG